MLLFTEYRLLDAFLKGRTPIRPGHQRGGKFIVKHLLATYQAVTMVLNGDNFDEMDKPESDATYWVKEIGSTRVHLEGGLTPREIAAGAIVDVEIRVKLVVTRAFTHFNLELSISKCNVASTGTMTLEGVEGDGLMIDEAAGLWVINGARVCAPARTAVAQPVRRGHRDPVHAPERRPHDRHDDGGRASR